MPAFSSAASSGGCDAHEPKPLGQPARTRQPLGALAHHQIVRYLPPWLLPIAVSIISRYYYHTSPRARRNITRYQQRLQRTTLGLQLPKHAVYRQIRSFAEAIADRFAVWQHRLTYRDLTVHDPDNLYHAH